MEPKIPTVFAVGLWIASGLAVATYTVIAFRETAQGIENLSPIGKDNLGLVATAATLAAEEIKPIDRNKFTPSSNVHNFNISPGELGFNK